MSVIDATSELAKAKAAARTTRSPQQRFTRCESCGTPVSLDSTIEGEPPAWIERWRRPREGFDDPLEASNPLFRWAYEHTAMKCRWRRDMTERRRA